MRLFLLLPGLLSLLAVVSCSSDPSAATASRPSRGAANVAPVPDRVIYDLSLTADTVAVKGVRRVFGARARQFAALTTRYATDTAGRYAALRTVNDEADAQLKTVIADPAAYRRYLTRRPDYYAGTPFTRGPGTGRGAATTAATPRARPTAPAAGLSPRPPRRAAASVRRAAAPARTKPADHRGIHLGLFKHRRKHKQKD